MLERDKNTKASSASAALGLAVRVAQGLSFPACEVAQRIDSLAEELTRLPGVQIRQYLEELLLGDSADVALQWLHDAGLLAVLLPELEATVDFTQEMGRRHKDVWKHTKQVVAQSVHQVEVRWAALFHDIGKVPTRIIGAGGKVTFHGHPEVGTRLFDRIARRLAFPRPLRSTVRFLILHHLRANQYDGSWTDSAVRRFTREMGDHLDQLLHLSRADITSARHHKKEAALAQIEELSRRIRAIQEQDSRVPPLPSGLGNHIMERFQLEPGPLIGKLKARLDHAIEQGEIEPHQEPEVYLDYLGRLPELPDLLVVKKTDPEEPRC